MANCNLTPGATPSPADILGLVPGVSPDLLPRLLELPSIYQEWNARLNLISRKDMPYFLEHHLLHALLMDRFMPVSPGDWILDFGTGGGIPGLPLALLHPEAEFTLIDSVEKKVKAVQGIVHQLGITNVLVRCVRGEQLAHGPNDERGVYRWVVSRGVAELSQLWRWVRPLLRSGEGSDSQGGLLVLKGGWIQAEVAPFGGRAIVHRLIDGLDFPAELQEYYAEKYLIHLPSLAN